MSQVISYILLEGPHIFPTLSFTTHVPIEAFIFVLDAHG